ncbi:hypothetical protein NF681_00805 (plasmid) [Comamonadaceae bacterium OTU4NAUVB1]|nr:hypothetical protein NF681_00805 [Comamonadaceae bacterium OTU4NAUVB1]
MLRSKQSRGSSVHPTMKPGQASRSIPRRRHPALPGSPVDDRPCIPGCTLALKEVAGHAADRVSAPHRAIGLVHDRCVGERFVHGRGALGVIAFIENALEIGAKRRVEIERRAGDR